MKTEIKNKKTFESMKKHFIYATLSAIALFGAVSFSACSSSEDVAEDINPTFDGEAVKTQFTISLPFNNNATTRQTSAVVQEGANTDITKFRGMQSIVLIPFQHVSNRTTRLGTNITLAASTLAKPTASNTENGIPAGKLLDNSNAVLYNDVTIPVGTSAFIFYGKAIESANQEFAEGRLTAAGLDGETSGITFTPTPVLGWNTAVSPVVPNNPVTTKGEAIAAYVTLIAAAKDNNGTPDDATDDATWAGCADATTNGSKPWYNAALGQLYTDFTSMKAGASSYVQKAVQDLYTSIKNNTDKVSLAIKAAIETNTYVSDATSGILTFTDAITGYPADNHMPEGAAALSWSDATPKVATAVAGSNFGHSVPSPGTAMNVVNMTNIVYPASLYYYMDSPIKTSNTSRAANYDGTTPWSQDGDDNDILDTYKSGTVVTSSTRSVAVTNPIDYAVGRLDVTVNAFGNAETDKYYDRKGIEVEIPTGGFQLTGVLIGGQKAVDYQFAQIPSTNTTLYTGTEYTIYDQTINAPAAVTRTAAAGPNYTLALATAKDQEVYVALEFVNNSANDFQGYDGVVKQGCKFYMIAKLDPKTEGTHATNVNNTVNQVFKQDFKTMAGFTFGKGSADANNDGVSDAPGGFANAYTTIPDLRTPQLELGLSVNLQWQPGITFSVTF